MGSPYVDNFIQQYTYFHPLLYPFHGYVCHTGLKGTQNQFSGWSENTEMCKYFHLPASFTCSIGNYTKEILSSLPVVAPGGGGGGGGSYVGSLFNSEEQQNVGS